MTPVRPPIVRATKRPWRQRLGALSFRQGHRSEWVAAAWLMMTGYQILGFRLRTPFGEIDILARRGRHLAVIEVKRRRTLEDALDALKPDQHERLLRAGRALVRQRPAFAALELRVDLIALAPGRFPRHLRFRKGDRDGRP